MAIALAEAGADIVSIQLADDPRSGMLVEGVKECGRSLRTYETDVSDSAKLRECFQRIWADGVTPDILLNCAGINRRGKVEELSDGDIDAVSGRLMRWWRCGIPLIQGGRSSRST
jgi:2-deoxy-D-gluconate 3-dehydrogenase